MVSRAVTLYCPSQGDGLVRAKVVAHHGDRDVLAVVVPKEFLAGGVLGAVGMLLGRRAVGEATGALVANRHRQVSGVPVDRLAPVVVADELPAAAQVRDDGGVT